MKSICSIESVKSRKSIKTISLLTIITFELKYISLDTVQLKLRKLDYLIALLGLNDSIGSMALIHSVDLIDLSDLITLNDPSIRCMQRDLHMWRDRRKRINHHSAALVCV